MFALVILILMTIVFLAICVLLLYLRRQVQRKANLMRQVQTTEASPAYGRSPGELVEVAGTLRCDSPLASGMAGRSCAYYHSEIVRVYKVADEDSDVGGPGSTSTRSGEETVASDQRFVPFFVEDASGAVEVHPEGAEVDAERVIERFEPYTEREGPMVSFAGETLQLGGGRRTIGYQHSENILPVDAPVYVLGVAREDGGIGADARPVDEPVRALMVGEDGKIGHLPSSGDKERRFLISHRSEEELERELGKMVFWMGVGAIATFVVGVVLAGISLIVAMS